MKNTIPDSEWQVMQPLWENAGLTGVEVHERLQNDWAVKTVNTFLSRLVERGLLRAEKEGRAYRYYPLLSRDECVRKQSASFVSRILGGAWAPLMAKIVEEADLSAAEIEEIEKLLKEKKKETNHARV